MSWHEPMHCPRLTALISPAALLRKFLCVVHCDVERQLRHHFLRKSAAWERAHDILLAQRCAAIGMRVSFKRVRGAATCLHLLGNMRDLDRRRVVVPSLESCSTVQRFPDGNSTRHAGRWSRHLFRRTRCLVQALDCQCIEDPISRNHLKSSNCPTRSEFPSTCAGLLS